MKFTPINFICDGCGAPLRFDPASGKLICNFCNSSTEIKNSDIVQEHDLHTALSQLEQNRPRQIDKEVECQNCGTTFHLNPYSTSTSCPYCNTPSITRFVNSITPESILPFEITHKKAKEIFTKWIGSLWFAPTQLKQLVDTDKRLTGYYLPYWTYDAGTTTEYHGQRGDIYYVTVQKRAIVNGKEQIITTQEPRIRWTPVNGRVGRYFDDVTVEASETLSRQILGSLGTWDTSRQKPFDSKYLSGFESEEYSIGLDNGFEVAQAKMNSIIRHDIRRDIGGDQQRIDNMNTRYANATFKNALFPIWTTHFRFKNKDYYYAINGQNGEISGERPYSYSKIFILIATIASIFMAIAYYSDNFDTSLNTNFNSFQIR